MDLPGVIDINFVSPDHYSIISAQDLRAEVAQAIVDAGGNLTSLGLDSFSLDDVYKAYFEEVNDAQKNLS
jgi:hypothetical protein